jgi:hypothetical protein
MKFARTILFTGLWAALALATPMKLTAQAPAGPLPGATPQPPPAGTRTQEPVPQIQPRTSIFGAWKLNRDESEDARKKMQDTRGNRGGNRRMGGPGVGGGPYGWPRGGGPRDDRGESDQDRERMQEVVRPANSLTIAEAKKDVEVDTFDDQERKRAFFTDGRKLQKPQNANYQEIAARWDGARLVSDEKDPRGRKLSRTYELSYDGTQLYETVRLTVGHSDSVVSIRYVYDQSGNPQSSSTK